MPTLSRQLRLWTLMLGVLQILVGCLVGLIPPSAVEWFRGLVMAHLELTGNGVLVIVLGLLLAEMRLPAVGLWVWFFTLQLGSWTNGAAGVLAALVGSSSPLMATANQLFPPPHGVDNPAVTALLTTCGVSILVALLITLAGLWRSYRHPGPSMT